MKKFFIPLVLATACTLAIADPWFTIMGDAADPNSDVIQFDPTPVQARGNIRLMTLRMNRSTRRTSTDGIIFRSFTSVIEFDCEKATARFTRTQFFNEPLWKSPGRSFDYPAAMVRPMLFRDVEPNPRERVMRAACATGTQALAPTAASPKH